MVCFAWKKLAFCWPPPPSYLVLTWFVKAPSIYISDVPLLKHLFLLPTFICGHAHVWRCWPTIIGIAWPCRPWIQAVIHHVDAFIYRLSHVHKELDACFSNFALLACPYFFFFFKKYLHSHTLGELHDKVLFKVNCKISNCIQSSARPCKNKLLASQSVSQTSQPLDLPPLLMQQYV